MLETLPAALADAFTLSDAAADFEELAQPEAVSVFAVVVALSVVAAVADAIDADPLSVGRALAVVVALGDDCTDGCAVSDALGPGEPTLETDALNVADSDARLDADSDDDMETE